MISKITGWGRSIQSHTNLKSFEVGADYRSMDTGRGFIPRGLGRSYGDSATNSGGTTLETNLLDGITVNPLTGMAVLGAGATILELEHESLKVGFFPHVVPGTAHVTIGGAIASDIHGKSHHRVGSFSSQVTKIKLLTANGLVKTIYPKGKSSKIFWATVGGMGLTGIILEVTMKLKKVETSYVIVEETRVKNLSELLNTMLSFNKSYLYTVAWVDLSGKFLGRGIVSGANHASEVDLPSRIVHRKLESHNMGEVRIPNFFGLSLINNLTIRVFNLIWFHKPLGKKVQKIQNYMHPLDGIGNWNSVYGKNGFIQYQFVVPFERSDIVSCVLRRLKTSKSGSFLTVLKSLGPDSKGLIAFPIQGWTLAIDLSAADKGLGKILAELDQMVLQAGGRVYITKDSRLSRKYLPAMYPNLDDWKKIKSEVDPNNLWQSDQGRRLGLC
jgi:decaprenylphospho-beta-D-ribofuranose 2-oxidase